MPKLPAAARSQRFSELADGQSAISPQWPGQCFQRAFSMQTTRLNTDSASQAFRADCSAACQFPGAVVLPAAFDFGLPPAGAGGAAAGALTGLSATVVDGGPRVDLRRMGEDLADRGVERLMVEGGGTIHTQFLTEDLADELHLVVAPFFVGDSRASRFVGDGIFPFNPERRATLADVRRIDDVVLLRYALSPRFDDEWKAS